MDAKKEQHVLAIIAKHGLVYPKDLKEYGVFRQQLKRMEKKGLVEKVTRGVYRVANYPVSGQFGLAEVSKKVPGCVICLLSALQFHEIGTELPAKTWLAIQRGAWHPSIEYPPVEIVTFSPNLMKNGITEHIIDGVTVRITDIPRTIADCFKFRNKIGLDTAIESLKSVLGGRRCTIQELTDASRQCRVFNVMRPYIEALI